MVTLKDWVYSVGIVLLWIEFFRVGFSDGLVPPLWD